MSTESISCQVVDRHRGSCRLPIHTRAVVLPHAGDHVEARGASRSRSCTSRPSSAYAWTRIVRFGLGCSASGILVTSLRSGHRRRAEPLDDRVDRAGEGDPDEAVAAPADVVGVARQVGDQVVALPRPRTGRARGVRRCAPRHSATQTKDSSAASATPLANARPVDHDA